ncbi:hypothetical protein OB905_06265 [Halobacteria archaeon AArc-dxtr1]|nr:hypothetical protein [Halobacteria archaeon AArc-dxtr1]
MASEIRRPEIDDTGDCQIEVRDPVERSSLGFSFPEPVAIEPIETDDFHFPVETAVRFAASAIECETIRDVHVWTGDGEFVAESTNGEALMLPAEEYLIDVAGSIKCNFRVTAPLQVLSDGERTSIGFERETTVELGIRSLHERPRGAITVSESPYSLLEALSYLGDSLQTLSPDRSFPTLRGHPPRFERGDSLEIPDGLSKPDTGIQLQLPPSRRYLYPATTLAYYLGAEIVPGREPRLVADRQSHDLGSDEISYDRAVSRILQHVFFLDCLTRTEGMVKAPLHERSTFERRLAETDLGPDAVDFAALYEAPIDERVARYLEIPFEAVVDDLPEWRLTADVQPDPEYLESLPYLAADLAIVRCRDPTPVDDLPETPEPVRDFFRDGTLEETDISFVDLPKAWSVEQTFVGDANPIAASKATLESFRSKFDRTATRSDDVTVTVIVNDDRMGKEREAVRERYRALEEQGATVTVATDASVDRIADILGGDDDFIHYIGHVDREGLECPDGHFDTTENGPYGVDAFILNGCQSYAQGEGLVRGGCVAGVVTTSKVLNEPAVEIGATFARLLTDGFTMAAATDVASRQRLVGNQYLVIGEGSFRVAERENGTPTMCQLEDREDGSWDLTMKTYPASDMDMGTLITPHIPGVNERYLTSGTIDTLHVKREELRAFLEPTSFPVEHCGDLVWSNELITQI